MTVQLARELGVSEVEVIRACAAWRWSWTCPAGRSYPPLRAAGAGPRHRHQRGRDAECSASSGTSRTRSASISTSRPDLDMHIRPRQLAAAFAVEKPGHMDGINTLSFQFYDPTGPAAFKVSLTFGGKAPPIELVRRTCTWKTSSARRDGTSGELHR